MAFDGLITDEAWRSRRDLRFHPRKQQSRTSQKWFAAITEKIFSLREMPSRCSVCPESAEFGQEVRILLHGRKNRAYKIYFSIRYETPATGSVRVFHVRHRARRALSADELQALMNDFAEERGEG